MKRLLGLPLRAGNATVTEISGVPAYNPYMEAALDKLRADGYTVKNEDVARLSPLLHEHINMLGRYSFSVPEAVAKGELRPLHDPVDND